MLVDLIYVILLVLAVLKGWQRGLIAGIFSFVAIIIGLAAALKLSAVVAGYIGAAITVSDAWLPVISFAVVFILVLLLIRLGVKALEKFFEVTMLGWANRLGGVIFYGAVYTLVFSVLIFYAGQLELLKNETIDHSVTYPFIQPWGPVLIDGLGSLIPLFKDLFEELGDFFAAVANRVSPAG